MPTAIPERLVEVMGDRAMTSHEAADALKDDLPEMNNPVAYIAAIFGGAKNEFGSRIFERVGEKYRAVNTNNGASWSVEADRAILELVNQKKTWKEVADHLAKKKKVKATPDYCRHRYKKLTGKTKSSATQQPGPPKKHLPITDDDLLREYNEGASGRSLARKYQVGDATIRARLHAAKRVRDALGAVGVKKPLKEVRTVDRVAEIMGNRAMSAHEVAEAWENPPESKNLPAYISSIFSAAKNRDGSKMFESVRRGFFRVAPKKEITECPPKAQRDEYYLRTWAGRETSLEEVAKDYEQKIGIRISDSTVWRDLKRLGATGRTLGGCWYWKLPGTAHVEPRVRESRANGEPIREYRLGAAKPKATAKKQRQDDELLARMDGAKTVRVQKVSEWIEKKAVAFFRDREFDMAQMLMSLAQEAEKEL